MLEFIQTKAKSLGAKNCPHCHELDYGFGLAGNKPGGGACINCQGQVQKYSSLQTMHFALAVYRELVAKYDDVHPGPDKEIFRRNLVQTLDNFLEPIIHHDQLPSDDDIIRLQEANKSMRVVIGSEKLLGGALSFEFGKVGLALSKTPYQTSARVLGTCWLAINYIQTYPAVPTPFSLPTPVKEKKGFFARLFS